MKTKQKGFTLINIIILILYVAAAIGWVRNILKIIDIVSDPINGMFIFRCVGVVFAPLGAILGYL